MAKYRSVTKDKVLERANARKNQVQGGKTLTFAAMPEGTKAEFFKVTKPVHNLDIIGYVITDPKHPDCDDVLQPGYLWHSRRYFVHRGVGAEENSYICPARTWGKPCPICEFAKQRKNSGEADQKELQLLKPKERQLFNVIDLDGDPKKILLWDVSYFLFGDKLDKELADSGEDDVYAFYEPGSGLSLRVRFEKKSFNKSDFWETDRIDFRNRKKDYPDDIIDDTFPLDDLLVELTYEQLEAAFVMGAEPEEHDTERGRSRRDDDDDEQPRRGRGRPRKEEPEEDEEPPARTKRKPEPDPEEEDDTPPPPPRRNRRSEPEPEPEDEPVEKPRRGRRSEPEETEEEPPARTSRRNSRREEVEEDPRNTHDDEPPAKKPKGGDGKCPQGWEFGKDCECDEKCDSCKVWGACNAALRKMG